MRDLLICGLSMATGLVIAEYYNRGRIDAIRREQLDDLRERRPSPRREADDPLGRGPSARREADDPLRRESCQRWEADDPLGRGPSARREADDSFGRGLSPRREADDSFGRERFPAAGGGRPDRRGKSGWAGGVPTPPPLSGADPIRPTRGMPPHRAGRTGRASGAADEEE